LLILGGLICQLVMSAQSYEDMVIPDVIFFNGSSTMRATNPTFAYPIKLGGNLCFPDELSECLSDPTLEKGCCQEIYDADSWPTETVTVLEEFLIIFFTVLFVAAVRLQLWKINCQRSSLEYCRQYWVLIFWDTLLGAFFAFEYSFFLTNFLKISVSAPRPNYYAVKVYGSIHSDHRAPLRGCSLSSSLYPLPHLSLSALRRLDEILSFRSLRHLYVDPRLPHSAQSGGRLSPLQNLLLELCLHFADAAVRTGADLHRGVDLRLSDP
jgi:hypothetical protein